MKPHVNAIAGRLSLRPPQRRSLEILDRVTEIVPLAKDADLAAALEVIRSEFPTVQDFEREFPSVCFALATGVGKTRLMGAFISYLHLAHGLNNFFVLVPNLTIYNKLITSAYLAALPDLVLIMDESHRYRASAGVRAINELKPVLGLELTATPFVESAKGATPSNSRT
jgi:superfamily II DNA or RNA helicase